MAIAIMNPIQNKATIPMDTKLFPIKMMEELKQIWTSELLLFICFPLALYVDSSSSDINRNIHFNLAMATT